MTPQQIIQARIDVLKATKEKQSEIGGFATGAVVYCLEFTISELEAALKEIESHTFHLS